MPDWSPCGRGVDLLRSCYETDMRFFTDDTRTTRVQWYFVDDPGNVLPFPTAFYSRNWDDLRPDTDPVLGEQPGASRPWRDGTPQFPVAAGSDACGTAAQFLDGEADPGPPPPVNVYGGPACCPLPAEPFMHFSCRRCPHGASSDYALVVSGAGLFRYLLLNGPHKFTYSGGCAWTSERFPSSIPPDPAQFFYYTMLRTGPGWSISLFDNTGFLGTPYIFNSADCLVRLALAPIPHSLPPIGVIFPTAGDAILCPGDPFDGAINCPGMAAPAKASYVVEVVDLGLVRTTLYPGWYPLRAVSPCVWEGRVSASQFSSPRYVEGLGFTARLEVQPVGRAVLTLARPLNFRGHGTATYTSLPFWDGTSPVALDRTATAGGDIDWPTFLRIHWPGNP